MKYYQKVGERGFLRWIVMVLIAIIIASYFFDFNVQDAVEDEQTQSNFHYIGEQVESFYQETLKPFVEHTIDSIEDFFTVLDNHLES